MNKKLALLIIAGYGSVLCTSGAKQIVIKDEKIVSLVERNESKELKKIGEFVEKNDKVALIPDVKNESDKLKVCLEKNVSSSQKEEKAAPKISKQLTRKVDMSNSITKDMITYKKHWMGNRTPSKFILKINGQEIKQGSTVPITVTDNKVSASYNFEFEVFGKVQRAGGKEFDLIVPEDADKVVSTFSWDEPTNLVFNQGTLIHIKDISN